MHWLRQRQVPVLAVRGNHDAADPLEFFTTAQDITGHVVRLADGLFVAGLGWAFERYYQLQTEHALAQCCAQLRRPILRRVMPRDKLIILTHYPPCIPGLFSELPSSEGHAFHCIRDFIEETQPMLVIHGHVHPWAGLERQMRIGAHSVRFVAAGPEGTVLDIEAPQNLCD